MGPDPAAGLFDTLLVRAGHPVDLDAHLRRLAASVQELYGVPVDVDALGARLLADARGLTTARVRTTYSPEPGSWEIEAVRIEEPGLDPRTLAVREVPGGLGRHKWVDRSPVAEPGEADDVLVVDDGTVLECGSANVFAVVAGVVVTPSLDGRILPGTVRARVLALLASERASAVERPLRVAELAEADEVFTTSSIRGIQPVVGCPDVATWPIGPITERLRAAEV
ncbi:MAG: aminotransferase class IV [Nocardioides sp.]